MTEPTLLIHKHEDGGASFGWLRDPERVDWEFWRSATDDETSLWMIMQIMRDADFREAVFPVLLAECNPLVAIKWLRLIEDVEDGRYTLPT